MGWRTRASRVPDRWETKRLYAQRAQRMVGMVKGSENNDLSLRQCAGSPHGSDHVLLALLSMIPDWVLGCDEAGHVVVASPSACHRLGFEMDELLGRSLDAIAPDGSLAECLGESDSASGRYTVLETCLVRKDGAQLRTRARGAWYPASEGSLGMLILRPLGEVTNEAEHITQAQKLEAIGQLAAGIAHEINTPTQYVGDNTRFLQDAFAGLLAAQAHYGRLLEAARTGSVTPELVSEVEEGIRQSDAEFLSSEVPDAISQSLEGVEQIARIVRAMKEFSHPGMGEKTFIDVNAAIENTITVARNEWKYVANMVTNLDPLLPLVPCIPGAFNQVILNILVNAAHAIEDAVKLTPGAKGTITVSTAQVADHVEIRIGDTGVGIPPEVRARVYDPFYTTKEVGRGTGQGLALTYSIVVEKHGGTISFDTEPGKGTTFVLRFPSGVAPSEEHHAA